MKHLVLVLLSVLSISVGSSFITHDFYTSMTKVDYNMASNTLQFSTKVDADHLEEAIGAKINAGNFESSLKSYFSDNIKVKINGNAKNIVYANYKLNGEVVWVYYNIPNVSSVSEININNTLLFNKYAEQQNYMSLNINGKKGSLVAKKGASSGSLSF